MRRDPNDTEPLSPTAKEDSPRGELPSATDVRGFKMSRTGTALGLGSPAVATPSGSGTSSTGTADGAIEAVLRGFDAEQRDVPVVVTPSTDGHRSAAYQGAHAVQSGQDTLPPERAVIVDVPTDPIPRSRSGDAPTLPPTLPRSNRLRVIVAVVCGIAVVILLLAMGRLTSTTQSAEPPRPSPASATTTAIAASPNTASSTQPTAQAQDTPSSPASLPIPAPPAPPSARASALRPQPQAPAPNSPATAKPADIDVLRETMKP